MAGTFAPLTALQRHVAYFDPGRTGVITIPNTARAISDLGVSWGLTWFLTLLIHAALAPRMGFNWRLRLAIPRIDEGVHAGDTGIFGGDGEIRHHVFEELFAKATRAGLGPEATVTHDDLWKFMLRDEKKSIGAYFSWAEAKLLLAVAKTGSEEVGGELVDVITKRRLLQFYEGRLLSSVARWRRVHGLNAPNRSHAR